MAFFKFRFPGQQDQDHSDSAAQSMESLRKRVKHRLMGSAVLVILAVIGFPLVFDTQPRPLPVDMAIDIPDKAKVSASVPPQPLRPQSSHPVPTNNTLSTGSEAMDQSLEPSDPKSARAVAPVVPAPQVPVHSATPAPTTQAADSKATPASAAKVDPAKTSQTATAQTKPAPLGAKEALSPKEEIVSPKLPAPAQPTKSSSKTDAKVDVKAEGKGDSKSESKAPATAKSDTNKPVAANKDTSKASPDSSVRYVVQVGAFSDDAKVKEVRDKLEKAGLHTFILPLMDKGVKRTRVRLGPFASKEEANKQAQRAKALNFQTSFIQLP